MFNASVLTLALLVGGNGNVAKEDMTSTPKEFEEFSKLMEGRWSVDITLIANWPAFNKKKGQKLVGYETRTISLDGKCLTNNISGGKPATKEMFAFDLGTKQIKFFNVGSGGQFFTGVIWKVNKDKWGWKASGTLGDGVPASGTGYYIFSEKGRKTVVNGDILVNGKKVDPLHDVFTKLSK